MLLRPEQPKNAQSPISDIDFGIEMSVRVSQFQNAPSPITITEFGMIVVLQPAINVLESELIIALQLSLESKTGLSSDTQILSIALQPAKACKPISLTNLGINNDVRL